MTEKRTHSSASTEERKTFTVPPGYEAVRDGEGRATGEVRLIPTDAQGAFENARQYVERAIASYAGDPADNQFQKGFLAALEVVRDEAFASQPSPAATVEAPPEVMERRRKGLSDYEKPPLGQPPSWLQEQEKIAAPHNGSSAASGVHYTDYEGKAVPVEQGRVMHGTVNQPQSSGMWQPIETAPQDGSEILILTSLGATQARFAPGEWHDHHEGREYDGPVWVCCDDQWQIEIEDCGKDGMHHGIATHWQPLPDTSSLPRPEHSRGKA